MGGESKKDTATRRNGDKKVNKRGIEKQETEQKTHGGGERGKNIRRRIRWKRKRPGPTRISRSGKD